MSSLKKSIIIIGLIGLLATNPISCHANTSVSEQSAVASLNSSVNQVDLTDAFEKISKDGGTVIDVTDGWKVSTIRHTDELGGYYIATVLTRNNSNDIALVSLEYHVSKEISMLEPEIEFIDNSGIYSITARYHSESNGAIVESKVKKNDNENYFIKYSNNSNQEVIITISNNTGYTYYKNKSWSIPAIRFRVNTKVYNTKYSMDLADLYDNLIGDLNHDNKIDRDDIEIMNNILIDYQNKKFDYGNLTEILDIDSDGDFTKQDVLLLNKWIIMKDSNNDGVLDWNDEALIELACSDRNDVPRLVKAYNMYK